MVLKKKKSLQNTSPLLKKREREREVSDRVKGTVPILSGFTLGHKMVLLSKLTLSSGGRVAAEGRKENCENDAERGQGYAETLF